MRLLQLTMLLVSGSTPTQCWRTLPDDNSDNVSLDLRTNLPGARSRAGKLLASKHSAFGTRTQGRVVGDNLMA